MSDRTDRINRIRQLDDDELARIDDRIKTCPDCGKRFFALGRQTRCETCSAIRQRKLTRIWRKKNY